MQPFVSHAKSWLVPTTGYSTHLSTHFTSSANESVACSLLLSTVINTTIFLLHVMLPAWVCDQVEIRPCG